MTAVRDLSTVVEAMASDADAAEDRNVTGAVFTKSALLEASAALRDVDETTGRLFDESIGPSGGDASPIQTEIAGGSIG